MKKMRTYHRYVISFLLFTLVPMFFLSLIIYGISSSGIEKQIQQNELQALQNYQGKVELMLKNIESISIQQSILNTNNYSAYNNLISMPVSELYQMQNSNTTTLLLNEFIKSIYVYYKDQPRMLSNGSINGWSTFEDTNWLDMYVALPENTQIETPAWLFNRKINASGDQQYIGSTLVRPFPILANYKVGYIVININTEKLFDSFISSSDKSYVVISPEGKIIYSTDRGVMEFSENYDFNKPLVKINSKDMLSFTVTSPANKWRYISLVDRNRLLTPIKPIEKLMYFILLLSTIAMIAVSFLASKVLYNPIKNLVGYVRKSSTTGDGSNASENEFSFIQKAFDNSIERNKHMESILDKSNDAIKEGMVLKLLRGEINSFENLEINKFTDIYGKQFVVLSIENYSYDSSLKSQNSVDSNRIIGQIFEKYSEGQFRFAGVGIYSYLISYILCFDEEDYYENHLDHIESIFLKIYGALVTAYSEHIAFGIGCSFNEPNNINTSFLESLNALKCRIFVSDVPVIFSHKLLKYNTETLYQYPLGLEIKITSAVKEGNFDSVKALINTIIDDIYTNNMLPDHAYSWLSHLRDMLFGIPSTLGYNPQEIFCNDYDKLWNGFKYIGNIKELKSYFIDVSIKIIHGLESKRINKNGEVINAIKQYIVAHLSEDTTLNNVASIFGISAPYLSSIFKQETGQNFLNYVISLKIEMAKKLLKETDMSVDVVSQKVGYYNNHGFYNTFKKYTGQTPNEFRKSSKISVFAS